MARGPHQQHRHQAGNQWIHFFVGSPRRFLWTFAGAFVLLAMLRPDVAAFLLRNAANAFVAALGPVLGQLVGIALAIWAIWFMLTRPFKGK